MEMIRHQTIGQNVRLGRPSRNICEELLPGTCFQFQKMGIAYGKLFETVIINSFNSPLILPFIRKNRAFFHTAIENVIYLPVS